MIGFRINIKNADLLQRLHNIKQAQPQLLKSTLEGAARAIRPEVMKAVTLVPGPPKYPLRWASEKQRRAFFATNGFGKGIPYKRTGQLIAAWQVKVSVRGVGGGRGGGVITVENPAKAARYVYGPQQQPFHLDTGWPTLRRAEGDREFFRRYDEMAMEEVRDRWVDHLERYIYGKVY